MTGDERDLETVGPYRLREVLGEGGMGTVYRATQSEPFNREVALKIIKAGMDTSEVVSRFQAEQQALALMDHSGIARVLDAGTTDRGSPFFVMELVRGVPLDEYCDSRKLTTRERIQLFVRICDAVHHAHQKGVIHRDLKPSNILVTVEDATPVPKIIDFGIAKALGAPISEDGQLTTMGQMLGTPAYMSPEQAERSGLDVDTRTDVYALGVILYELLSGVLPFDRSTFDKPDFLLQYFLRELEIPKPSTRFASLADTQVTVAASRRTDVRTLRHELRGDLDWIIMRAVEKDRTRRYASASELAADLARYLDGEAVLARPPSVGYRLGKLARRHRAAVVATAAVLVALIAGTVVSTVGFVRAERSAMRAEAERARAQAVSDFLNRMLRMADPVNGGGPTMTVRELLDDASAEVRAGEFADQPTVELGVRRSLGGTYMLLSALDEAEEHLEVAREIALEHPDIEMLERIMVLNELGQLRRRQGAMGAAEELYRTALMLADSSGLARDGGEGEASVNDVRNDLALTLRGMDRLGEAAEILEELVASRRRMLAPDDLELATSLNNLALVRRAQGDLEGAARAFRETEAALRLSVGESHLYVAAVMESVGSLEQSMGRLEVADSLMRASLAMRREIVGDRHRDVVNGLRMLGLLQVDRGRLDEGRTLLEEGLSTSIDLLGPSNPMTGSMYFALGRLETTSENWPAASEAFTRSVAIRDEALGASHRLTLNARAGLAAAAVGAGRYSAGEAQAREVVRLQEEAGVLEPDQLGGARASLGRALAGLGRFEEAEAQLEQAHGILDGAFGGAAPLTQAVVRSLVELYAQWGNDDRRRHWEGLLEVD